MVYTELGLDSIPLNSECLFNFEKLDFISRFLIYKA